VIVFSMQFVEELPPAILAVAASVSSPMTGLDESLNEVRRLLEDLDGAITESKNSEARRALQEARVYASRTEAAVSLARFRVAEQGLEDTTAIGPGLSVDPPGQVCKRPAQGGVGGQNRRRRTHRVGKSHRHVLGARRSHPPA